MPYDVKNFEEEVIQRSTTIPVLVDFWAEWCGPCRILSPVLERLAEQSGGKWALAKVNTEEFPDVAGQYGIQSIPNVKLFYGGKVVNEFVGALPEYVIAKWLKTNVPSKHQAKIEVAKTLLDDQRPEDARSVLTPILADETDNQEAKALLAKACLFTNPEKAGKLISEVDDPRYGDLAESVKTLVRLTELNNKPELLPVGPSKKTYQEAVAQTVAGDFEKALPLFIDVIRNDRYYDNDGARKACIAIFKYLGEEHPITQKHRREFSSALY